MIRKTFLLSVLSLVFVLAGCGAKEKEKEAEQEPVKTFSEWTDVKVFGDIPAMQVEGTRIIEPEDYGADTYVMSVEGTTLDDYRDYCGLLEKEGYGKESDNGEDGLSGFVYTATYKKNDKVLTVTQIIKSQVTYLSACEGLDLSPHLHYSDEYVSGNIPGAKTTLHMPELYDFGDSYILQLKNGHFVLFDGGMEQDGPYLLDYLETLAPEGEKPYIEGWFITHLHADHMGVFTMLMKDPEAASRIVVEGVYVSEPSMEVCTKYGCQPRNLQYGAMACRNSEGRAPAIYRPQTGQRYYFDDITIDIMHTQEQLPPSDYENNFNDSSSWMLLTIDGQTFLDAGDTSEGSLAVVKRTYDEDFFDFDIISLFHHGQNVYESYIDYFKYKVVLYPGYVLGSITANWKIEENERVQKNAQESMCYADGTKVLTFPYEVGTAKVLPMRKWIYHPNRPDYALKK